MKQLKILNFFFVGLPVLLCLIGLINEDFLFYGMFSTILTGIFQVVIGLKMLIDDSDNKKLQFYIVAVIIYFIIFFFTNLMDDWKYFYPQPFYALYFTYILHQKK